MNLLSIGNLNSYIKNLKLQSQWTLKQQTGQYDAKGKSLEDWLDGSPRQAQETAYGERGDKTLKKIHQKLEAGGRLTQKEREYLQKHDPEAYQDLVNQEREQRAYEQELRRCTTQEEVERLRMTRINASLARIRAVENNPHIPLSKKLEIAMAEKQRVDRIAESTQRFVASGEYAKLPTRAEEAQANEDAADVFPSVPEGADRTEPGAEPRPPEAAQEDPRVDVESQEERKVRRARARAAYAAARSPAQPAADGVDTRA